MNKRGLFIIILLFSMSFVSAQIGLGEFLDAFGGENLLLIGSFIISFVLINFILGRVPIFKDKYTGKKNKAVPGIIAFIISVFIIYGINAFDFDLPNFFFNLGLSAELLEILIILVVLGGLVFLFWKFKSKVLLFLGLLLVIIVIFTDWIYEKDTVFFMGLGLIAAYIIIKIFFKKKPKIEDSSYSPSSYTYPSRNRYEGDRYERDRRIQLERERREEERRREERRLEAIRKEQGYIRQLEEQERKRRREKEKIKKRFGDIRGQRKAEAAERERQRAEEERIRQEGRDRTAGRLKKERARRQQAEEAEKRRGAQAREEEGRQTQERAREEEGRQTQERARRDLKEFRKRIITHYKVHPDPYHQDKELEDLATEYFKRIQNERNPKGIERLAKEFIQKKEAILNSRKKAGEAEKRQAKIKALEAGRERKALEEVRERKALEAGRERKALGEVRERKALEAGRERKALEEARKSLQDEYNHYKKLIYKWGRVPKKGTTEYNEYIFYYRKLEELRNRAAKQDIKLV